MGRIGMNNTYTIYKYENGRKKILAHFHNIVVNNMRNALASRKVEVHSVWFGSGSREPSESDTALTSPLWTFTWNYGNIISAEAPQVQQDGSWLIKFTGKIDASASYVGTVSEVGLYLTNGSNLQMGTHALIKDAEGNPMSITKTDTEVLYIDVRIRYQLTSSTEFEWNPFYTYLLMQGYSSQSWITLPSLYGIRMTMCAAYPDLMSDGNRMGSAVNLTNSYNASSKKITCSNGRFGTENQTSQQYVNAIALAPAFISGSYDYYLPSVPIGWVKFPNREIFPNRTLSGMTVGTGDGVTTEFKPPLNLWVKDTEKIYVDGVLQERGVDYTCDHQNNLDNLVSLQSVNFCTLRSQLINLGYSNGSYMGCHPLKGGFNKTGYSGNLDQRRVYVLWDNDHPLEWEMNENPQIGNEADGFYLAQVHCNVSYTSMTNAKFTVSWSDDANEWTDEGTYTYTGTGSATDSHMFQFANRISAKYWRVTADLSACYESVRTARLYVDARCYLKRTGQPIIFTNAPAVDSVITMEADIDRPMKNSNFVLDFNPEFQL